MAFTTNDLERIERAIARGTLTVRYADRTVTYQSMRELMRARDLMRSELGPDAGGTKGRRRTMRVQQSGRGY